MIFWETRSIIKMNLPNKLTVARIIAVPVFIILYMLGQYIPALVVFVAASLTDLFDGKIARKYGLVTNFGKIMDPLADKILVYAAFCLMVADGNIAAWMFIIVLAREFLLAGVRTVAASDGIVIAADMSGKIKTTLQMIAVIMIILVNGLWSFSAPEDFVRILDFLAQVVLWASIVMTVWSGASYIIKNKQVFKEKE